ncbi:MAG: DUF4390 domain-containing protein [Magnetococcales bacterium]|nr:DUF4390 domain-containing protein [Magnetococcales bacterium]
MGLFGRRQTAFHDRLALSSTLRAPVFLALLIAWTLGIAGCEKPNSKTPAPVIQQAEAFLQGEKLLARVTLDPTFLDRLSENLQQGEPLLATYRFRLIRKHPWLPNAHILDRQILRLIRMRLITERYELQENQQRLVHYTTDENEALQFIGNPRFLLLHPRFKPLPDTEYILETRVTITHEGMSRMFRFLDRWLTWHQPMDFFHQSELP